MTYALSYNGQHWELPARKYNTALMGLGDVYQVSTGIAAGAGTVASGAALAATLITVGAAAQAIPIVGTIAGAVAIAAGFIAKAFGKAKAIKDGRREVDAQNNELNDLNLELESQIRDLQTQSVNINAQLKQLGLGGVAMDGFGDFLKKVFTPGKVEEGKLADSQAENARLTALVNDKIAALQSIQNDLQSKYDRLTKGTTTNDIIMYSALGISALALTYGIYTIIKSKRK